MSTVISVGGSPGLVVMGGDSRPEGRGFESKHHTLNRHFFAYICSKNCNVCLKRPKNEKGAMDGPFINSEIGDLERGKHVCYFLSLNATN